MNNLGFDDWFTLCLLVGMIGACVNGFGFWIYQRIIKKGKYEK